MPIVWAILSGLIQLAIQYLKRAETKDGYAKAREEQQRAYEEAGIILDGSGDELTRLAQYRARLLRSLLRTRKLRKAKSGNAR